MTASVVEVVVDLPLHGGLRAFQYQVSAELNEQLQVGSTVVVPFLNRLLIGYVLELNVEPRRADLKAIISLVAEAPIFNREQRDFIIKLAEYYLASPADCLKLIIPPGRSRRLRQTYVLGRKAHEVNSKSALPKELLSAKEPFTKSLLSQYLSPREVRRLLNEGIIERKYLLSRPRAAVKTADWAFIDAADIDEKDLKTRGPKQKALLAAIKKAHALPVKELLRRCEAGRGSLKSLVDKKFIRVEKVPVYRTPPIGDFAAEKQPRELTKAQQQAVKTLAKAVSAEKFSPFLLVGVTGSGKTEVYMRVIKEVLKTEGRGAIVLVPEIALTPQLTQRFQQRFAGLTAVLHSRLSIGERYDQWRRIAAGEYRIVIGPRSALFAPIKKVGLIVIDEEHETSYKQNRSPRYQARDAAFMLARAQQAVLLLGSATPSLEMVYQADKGLIKRLSLPRRVNNRPLPRIELVDMRGEATAGNFSLFSRLLRTEMRKCVDGGRKMIVLLNRRGYASFRICRECGYVERCRNCEVSLTYHRLSRQLICHHCGYSRRPADSCPMCGGKKIADSGAGTERVEKELRAIFPQTTVVRLDADTTAGKDAHRRRLREFARSSPAILLGTQMVAKGLDFPDVDLIGVINADTALNMPDFRAGERTFQLLMQVAGRSGRGENPGKVIVQTYLPEHYAVKAAAEGDIDSFYRRELDYRKRLKYPPYTSLINIVISGPDPKKVKERALEIFSLLEEILPTDKTRILGPGAAPIAKLKGRWRWHIFLTTERPSVIKSILRENENKLSAAKGGLRVIIDVDPTWVM